MKAKPIRSKPVDKQAQINKIRQFLNIQKHGINYFCICPFCQGGAKYSFCIPNTLDEWFCFECKRRGTLNELIETLTGNTNDAHQTSIV